MLAVGFSLGIAVPVAQAIMPQLVKSQAELSLLRGIEFWTTVVAITVSAALRASFQATLLERRGRLGRAWFIAYVGAALGGFLLITAVVQVLQSGSVYPLPSVDGF